MEPSMDDRSIPRQTVRVEITLASDRNLSGELQIDLESRLSDFLNRPERFIAVKDKDGITRIVHKAHIVEVVEL
jgi:HPt (histidine-containing phosphotransfer) domain-containing protein